MPEEKFETSPLKMPSTPERAAPNLPVELLRRGQEESSYEQAIATAEPNMSNERRSALLRFHAMEAEWLRQMEVFDKTH